MTDINAPSTISTDSPVEILQICQSYTGPFMDCARQYAALFKDKKYRVTTIFLVGPYNEKIKQGVESDEVIFFEYLREQLDGLKLGIISRIKRLTQNKAYHLCIAHRTKPTYLALLATQIPVISVHHAMNDFDKLGRRVFVNFFKSRLMLLGVSDAVRDDIRQQLPKWPSSRIQTLYNRVDINSLQKSQLDRLEARKKLNLPVDTRIIANVGRLHPDKDQATLIKAFALAKPKLEEKAILVVMGEGKLELELKALCSDLGIQTDVIFTGQVPEAKRYFKAFDLFVLSSDHEPFGMVLLEAMVAGLPVICSNCGGGAEVVKGIGKLFPLGDASALAEFILYEINQPRMQLSQAVINHVNTHFSDTAAKKHFFDLIPSEVL